MPDPTVEALHVVVDPEKIVTSSEEVQFQRLREQREGTAEQRAEATRTAFVTWINGADDAAPKVQWRAVTGTEEQTVCAEADEADVLVLVLAPEHNMDSGDALHAAVFRSQKPVLVVPHDWRAGSRRSFAHIAVGMSDSAATQHAIESAGPWLRAAERVTAIRIGEQDDAALGMTRLLSELGTTPELHIVAAQGSDLGAQIVAEAKSAGADLLVAGAYRHAQMIEWLMGGTTRHLLAAADIPLLMMH
ncbi:universal stress protein (plasmid) [Sphingomonas paeninsulae]|uniref:Universal stress protein n=1 Tax=Sphingomonas paeninsulae TaxID=2319844 RepID=A0A494TFX6_SPHPE|nr:universal stress protein [Sphingomonas paeninsulae]